MTALLAALVITLFLTGCDHMQVQYPYPWMIIVSSLFFVIIAILAFFNRKGAQKNKIIAQRTNELVIQKNILQTILDSMPDIVFSKDKDLKYTSVNKTMTDFFKLESKNVIGKSAPEVFSLPGNVLEKMLSVDREVINEKRSVEYSQWIPHWDGSVRFVETIKVPIIQDGAAIGLVGIARDTTEKKQMSEILAANNAKSEFFSMISHEIRTPVKSIMGFAELALKSEFLPLQVKDHLEKINKSAKWLIDITSDVLDISKIEAGKMELEKTAFNLNDIITHCQSVVQPFAKEKSLELVIDADIVPLDGKKLLGDPVRLYQTLLNLLTNAIKFTANGRVTLIVLTQRNDNNVEAYFAVKDTGVGMVPEQMADIFEPFIQADSGSAGHYNGTGLGLNIARKIVRLMGGEIMLESVYGEGSTFSFKVKFDIEASSDCEKTESEKASEKNPLEIESMALEKASRLDSEFTFELFEKLEDLLKKRSRECIKLLDLIRLVNGAEELVQQIEVYDFKLASQTLSELKKRGNL